MNGTKKWAVCLFCGEGYWAEYSDDDCPTESCKLQRHRLRRRFKEVGDGRP